ncbi:MAG: sigma-70 family RNA polymerase sigma factor [Vicinamibacterales bacterium]
MAASTSWTLPQTPRPDWQLTVLRDTVITAPDSALGELSESALVAACHEGRAGAFDVVVERHRRQVYQLCYRFVNNHEDASDLSQDTFVRAYRGLKNFKGQSSLGTWLYRIGVNVCLNRMSVKEPFKEPIEDRPDLADGRESASERLLRDERALQVRAAIARLPTKQRTVLVLRMDQELSHQEIAQILGSSVGAVKANVFHAIQNLKKILAEELG